METRPPVPRAPLAVDGALLFQDMAGVRARGGRRDRLGHENPDCAAPTL